MNAADLLGIGGAWTRAFWTTSAAGRSSVIADAPVNASGITISSAAADAASPGLRDRLRGAATALHDALAAFERQTTPVYQTPFSTGGTLLAALNGTSARVGSLQVNYQARAASTEVNTNVSTVRSSSGTLGLAGTASELHSAMALGLTLTESSSRLASSSPLALDTTSAERVSTIASTAEMNAASSSLSSYDLTFQNSTSHAELSGAYSGSATALTIRMTTAANLTLGSVAAVISFDVVDEHNTKVDSYTGTATAGQVIDLAAVGLKVRFTAGSMAMGATATTNVSQTPTTVDAAALFNAGWGSAPRFEGFQQVRAGSFTINGTTIAVTADDSINAVIARINSSGAGVTASVSGDRISLSTTAYSESAIVLGNDTSGFLAATKLSGATTTVGNVHDDQQVFADTGTRFKDVTTGSFTINGVAISITRESDSLASVIARINGSGTGVVASYDASLDTIVLESAGASEALIVVDNDNTGFLSAANLSSGNTVVGNLRDDQQVMSTTTGRFKDVVTGSFTINGVSIAVNKDTDTVASVIARINGAGAGVTASLNQSTGTIELVATAAGPSAITVGDDTARFLAAADLSSTNTVLGTAPEDDDLLSTTQPFGAVANGSFTVNGVAIAVDAAADTLQTVIGKINAAGTGVTASYDTAADTLVITPNTAGATLTLADDTSGFLAAAKIATGAVGTRLNADGAFNATGVSGPLFDTGVAVQAGTFTVNGVTIAVAADDTVNGVLAKITASAAGVNATYDATTDKVTLTATDPDAGPVTVGNDTSGFLAAVKLDATATDTTETVTTSAYDDPLAQISEYAGVTTGTLTVNGQSIAVDPNTTTLRGLIAAIDGMVGVTATLNETTGAIQISSDPGTSIATSDTSGVLTALGIPAGTYTGSVSSSETPLLQTGTVTTSNAADVVDSVADALKQLNEVIADVMEGRDTDALLQRGVSDALGAAVDMLRDGGVRGLSVSDADSQLTVTADAADLVRALDGIGADDDVDAAIETLVERLETGVAAAAGWDSPPQPGVQMLQLADSSRAQLMADQTHTSLLMSRTSLQPQESDETKSRSAMKAYSA